MKHDAKKIAESMGEKEWGADKFFSDFDVETELKLKEHKFTCGTDGHVVDEFIFKIKVPENFTLQPHSHFEEELADKLSETFVDAELVGYLDICADEDIDGED